MKQFLISPPFGNWLSHPLATRVRGSYTREPRPGLIWRTMTTLRYQGGGNWLNGIGLRNPGLRSVSCQPDQVYSVVGFGEDDWKWLLDSLPAWAMVEINHGCPNAHGYTMSPAMVRQYAEKFKVCSFKVQPVVASLPLIMMALDAGVSHIHMGNAFPVEFRAGPRGFSGPANRDIVLPQVEAIADLISARNLSTRIIGGGGIRTVGDVLAYQRAGATHFSLSTAWFRPFRTRRLLDRTATALNR